VEKRKHVRNPFSSKYLALVRVYVHICAFYVYVCMYVSVLMGMCVYTFVMRLKVLHHTDMLTVREDARGGSERLFRTSTVAFIASMVPDAIL
jgi:hypothetical protein